MPRFDQSFSGLCEQNLQDTLQLKQRYLDAKAKRPPKAKDKKQPDQAGNQQQPASIQSSVHVQQKFLKRPAGEEHDSSGGPQGDSTSFEPPVKLQCTTQQHGNQNEGITKFSLEIVQQLEFTTSAANSQPQQISTNVTVKAHTNASVKSDVSSPKSSNPSTPSSNLQQQQSKSNIGLDVGTLVECVKQEPDNDFADLDQCAAALEKDAAANGGAAFGGFPDLIGDDTNDEIITSDAFNDLISDISNYPELMKDFDFEDTKPESSASANGLKMEDVKDTHQNAQQSVSNNSDPIKNTQSPLIQNQNYSPSPVFDNQNLASAASKNNNRMVYPNLDFSKTEMSPAAQTLKQMAEQHQHKNQMGLAYNPNNRVPNARSPYSDFQYNTDYGSPTSNPQFKNSPNFPQPDLIKQEMIFQGNEFDAMKRKGPTMYSKQYSPYSSPNHGSPGYLPRTNSGTSGGSTPGGPFGGGTPPRPPSGHGGGGGQGATLQINQAQQLHISQQGHGHNIQVSAGQHLQLSGELKGNVSIAAHQGLHFNQQHTPSNNASSQQQQQQSQSQSGQQNQMPPQSQSQMGGNGSQNVQNPHGNINMSQQQSQSNISNPINNPMMSNAQQIPTSQHMGSQQGPMGNPMQGGGMQGMQGMGNGGMQGSLQGQGNMQGGMPNSGGMQGNLGAMGNNNMMGGSPLHPGMGSLSDTYSMSQTQTINFTQQSLRQRANGVSAMGSPMAGNPPMNPMNAQMGAARMMNQQQQAAMEQQQKLLQQQQMLRNQQQQQQQQAAAAAALQQHLVRPPPPDYKASAGMMQPRYGAGMRRMPHQPIPPSGPMMRPHSVYMLQQQQQQHLATRNMYPRQQNPMAGPMEAMQQKTEWRHILLSQQQNANFNNPMRPSFQQGFNMNPGSSMQQMTALQHQQMRMQHGLTAGGIGSGNQQVMGQPMGQAQVMNQGAGAGPMAQMSGMNQQMQLMQQQNLMQQQQNSQMSMTNIHMQQSQSLTLNQSLQQHQQQNSINQLVNNTSAANSLTSFNTQAADFNLEFLDNLSASDAAPFTEQELLSSFDSDSGFNLDF